MSADSVFKKMDETCRLRGLLPPGSLVVCGFSGGPDSSILLRYLTCRAEDMGWTVYAVHVNHGIRGEEADRDEDWARKMAEEWGASFQAVRFDCPAWAKAHGKTEEEAGRIFRYRAFDDAAARVEAAGIPKDRVRITVAHNADDQAETVLLRILRGTGTDGLSGIPYSRKTGGGFLLVRPLLDISKEEILEACAGLGIEPRIDRTNFHPAYGRNRVRLEILPVLERFEPAVREHLARLAEIAGEDRAYFENQANRVIGEAAVEISDRRIRLEAGRVAEEARPVRMRIYREIFRRVGLDQDLTRAHLLACDRLTVSGESSAETDLPHGWRLSRVYGEIRAEAPAVTAAGGSSEAVGGGQAGWMFRILDRKEIAPGQTAFSMKKLEEKLGADFFSRLRIRTRKPGDYIFIGFDRRKKIQDLFVDEKVPRRDRDRIFMLASGSEILYIPAETPENPGLARSRRSWGCSLEDEGKNGLAIFPSPSEKKENC